MNSLPYILCGNDGTGKTTICKLLNDQNIQCFERSTKHGEEYQTNVLDNLTLLNLFDINDVNIDACLDNAFYVILDADIPEILKRIKMRSVKEKWDLPHVLFYYRQRFRDLAFRFGIPLINTTNKSIDDVIKEIIDVPKWYYELRSFQCQTLKTIEGYRDHQFSESEINEYLRPFGMDSTSIPNVNPSVSKFKLVIEGESKKIYKPISENPYLKDVVFIVLKNTIYSHSMQSTGTIQDIERVRAHGSQIFLEMLFRTQTEHAYQCVNKYGVIVSLWISFDPRIETVIKHEFVGTDKHSYVGLDTFPEVLNAYQHDYVRFDWRNPNHLYDDKPFNKNPFYYIVEQCLGKEEFFKRYLQNNSHVKPLGDKTISADLIKDLIDVPETKSASMRVFKCFTWYLKQVGIMIQDLCLVFDKTGTMIFSEINQDCMRMKTGDDYHFDKNLWRQHADKQTIMMRWKEFNDIFEKYFRKHLFKDVYLDADYVSLVDLGADHKDVIVTVDIYNNQPVLVKRGRLVEPHTETVQQAFEKICLFPNILCVDLNGAVLSGNNRSLIADLSKTRYPYVGGGIRDISDAEFYLKNSARRIVIGTNFDLIPQIPKNRLIVELSVDENMFVLTNGRQNETHKSVFDFLREISFMNNVDLVSITFHQTEGTLEGIPRQKLLMLYEHVPWNIKLIVAGGINSISDIEFVLHLGFIPQIGSGIWTGKIDIGDIFVCLTTFIDGIVPAVIQDTNGLVKGQVYLNPESLKKTCETKELYRWSRRLKRVIKKGEDSLNTQKVLQICHDCDNDSLLITVDCEKPFCHLQNEYACFKTQSIVKTNINGLFQHISKSSGPYSTWMKEHPGASLIKIMEEFWEIVCSIDDKKNLVHECSDFLFHFMVFLQSKNISITDVLNELNARKYSKIIDHHQLVSESSDFVIAIASNKYTDMSDSFVKDNLGMTIHRATNRNLKIEYEITNQDLYDKYFSGKRVVFVSCHPKDMPWLFVHGKSRVHGCISYNSIIDNHPTVLKCLVSNVCPDLRISLLQRPNAIFNTKIRIAAEHPKHVYDYFCQKLRPDQFTIDKVMGASESFLVNLDMYDLCDAIVSTGSTIRDNGLTEYDVICHQIIIGVFVPI